MLVPILNIPIGSTPPNPQLKQPALERKEGEAVEWDGWPDGTFERLFTHAEVDATQGLQVHWAMR